MSQNSSIWTKPPKITMDVSVRIKRQEHLAMSHLGVFTGIFSRPGSEVAPGLSRRHIRRTAIVAVPALLASMLVVGLEAAGAADAVTACTPDADYTNCVVFSYTGSDQQFSLPAGAIASNVLIKAWGAGGGGDYTAFNAFTRGGGGGFAQGLVDLTGVSSMDIIVGQGGVQGGNFVNDGVTGAEKATYGGGGPSAYDGSRGYSGASGGGRSAVRANVAGNLASGNEILTAGGGGGGNDGTNGDLTQMGGAGGGLTGANGSCTKTECTLGTGGGATPTSGGTAGSGQATEISKATAGAQFTGGQGGCASRNNTTECGGGGGMYSYPNDAPGGGGSGHVDSVAVTSPTLTPGSTTNAANAADAHYGAGIGTGGGASKTTQNGGNGRVVIQFSVPTFTVTKAVDSATAQAGAIVTYTVTLTNPTIAAFTADAPASFTDDLSGVLDDSTYNGDASNGATVTGQTLSWSGALTAHATQKITYSVTVDKVATGDHTMTNSVVPGAGGTCATAASCATTTTVAVVSTITVTKKVASRAAAADQFTVGLNNASGSLTSATTTGTSTTASTSDWPVSQGTTYTVTDKMAAGSPSTLDAYSATVVCTDSAGGTVPTGGTAGSWTFTPPAANAYTCNVTNTAQTPGISIARHTGTPVDVNKDGLVDAGDTMQYTFTVMNTGNVPLTDVAVTDEKAGAVNCLPTALAAGESAECSTTRAYTITAADERAGSVDNTATATGTPPGGSTVTSTPSTTTTAVVAGAPALTVLQTSDKNILVTAETVTYSFLVTNTGNVTLTDPEVTVSGFTGTGTLSVIACPASAPLPPQGTRTCTATYTVTAADVASGRLAGAATVSGLTPSGERVTSAPSVVTIRTVLPAAPPVVSPVPPSLAFTGSDLTWPLIGGAGLTVIGLLLTIGLAWRRRMNQTDYDARNRIAGLIDE